MQGHQHAVFKAQDVALRILGANEDLPLLPEASIMLIRNLNNPSPITECLAEYIIEGFKL